jgi:cbb3-type cytochrome oxidase subunit 3
MLSPFFPKTKQPTKKPLPSSPPVLLPAQNKTNKQTNKQLTHRKKSKSTQPTKPTNKNPQALSLVQFLTTQFFFYLVRKQNKEIEDHTKMHYILHPSSANLQNVFATKQRSSWFVFLFFLFFYCKSLLPAASQTICQPPTLLLTTNWCNQTAINQPITQFFFPFPNALLLPPPLPSASAH